jgi:beta-N-acetylhexosaminidase
MLFSFLFLFLFALNCVAVTPVRGPAAVAPPPSASTAEDIQLEKMTVRQKVGQLLMVGFFGQAIENGLQKSISSLAPGAVIVFGRNVKSANQIVRLTTSAQALSLKASHVPLLIAVDQEGGDVIRLKTAMPLPSALSIGETKDSALAEAAGLATGQLLKTLGFNMNLAPVLDVADPHRANFIGTRTYGGNPQTVGRMGVQFSEGLARAGVLPTGKHFPGHGGVNEDSHEQTPQRTCSLDELRKADLVPFLAMQKHFGSRWATMLAHIAYPEIDSSGLPATFSHPIVTDILRNEVGFNGLVITDDIQMGGATAIKDIRERAVRAIEAGADMILVAWSMKTQLTILEALERAVSSGRISKERLDESVRRILVAKNIYAKKAGHAPTAQELRLAIRNPKFTEIALATANAAVGRPEDKAALEFKEFAGGRPVLVFSANRRFFTTFHDAIPGRSARYFGLDSDRPEATDRIMRSNPEAVGVFYVSGSHAIRLVNQVSDDVARRMLVVTVETDGMIEHQSDFRHVVNAYYRHPNLGEFVANSFFKDSLKIRTPASDAAASSAKPAKRRQPRSSPFKEAVSEPNGEIR